MYETTITTRRTTNGLHRLAHVHASRAVRLHCSIHRTAWQKRAALNKLRWDNSAQCVRIASNLLESAHARLAAYSTRCVRSAPAPDAAFTARELTEALSTLWSFGSHDVR